MTTLTVHRAQIAYLDVVRLHGEVEAADDGVGAASYWFEIPVPLIDGLDTFLTTPGRWMLEFRPVGRMFRDGYRWELPEVAWTWSADADGRPVVRVTADLFDDEGEAVPPVVDNFPIARLTLEDVAELRAGLARHEG